MNENLPYILNSVSYSLAGFLVGWLSCTVFSRKDMSQTSATPEPVKQAREPFSRDFMIGVVLLVLASLTVGSVIIQQQAKSCQVDFNTRSAAVVSTRAAYAEQDRAALVQFLRTLDGLSSLADSTSYTTALHTLLNTYEETQEKRAKQPLPSLKEACG